MSRWQEGDGAFLFTFKILALLILLVDFRSRCMLFSGRFGSLLAASEPAGSLLTRFSKQESYVSAPITNGSESTLSFNIAKILRCNVGGRGCLVLSIIY
jgi:hypothetical protein